MILESISHLAFQQYWWVIISLLGALLVFMLFVQGGQTLIYTLGKTPDERAVIVNSLGHKWEITFTTLVTFGGAFFAAFPLFYSTSFGGAYWVWMAILFCFIIQAISYEFRSKPRNIFGHKTYETFLFINGSLGTFLLGVAVSTFFTGSQFSVNDLNQSGWETPFHGLEALLNIRNLLLGAAVLFLSRALGTLYFINNINDKDIIGRCKTQLWINGVPFVGFFVAYVVTLVLSDGFAYHPETMLVSMEKYKYLHNLLEMPLIMIFFLAGVVLVLTGLYLGLFREGKKAIWPAGLGTVLTVFALFAIAGFNNTSFYPSVHDLQSSLTIQNASSSLYTLKAMSFASIMVPFVFGYIFIVWRKMNKKQISKEEVSQDSHAY